MKKTNFNKHIALVLGVSAIAAAACALAACGAKTTETTVVETTAAETTVAETAVAETAAETEAAETDLVENESATGTESSEDTPAESSSFANAKLVTHSIIAESLPENFPGDQPVKAIGGFFFEDEQPAMENVNGDVHEELLFLNYDENCLVLDANDGYPVDTSAITEPVPAVAYISQAMTMSLPPQTNPELILVCPEGGCTDSFPYYVTITDNTLSGAAEGSHVLSTTRGDIIVTSADTEIIPYRTKQIVVIDAITEGTDCIVWLDNDMIATKIMVFAE